MLNDISFLSYKSTRTYQNGRDTLSLSLSLSLYIYIYIYIKSHQKYENWSFNYFQILNEDVVRSWATCIKRDD